MTRAPKNPVAGPPSGHVAQAPVPGEPAPHLPPRGAGGKTSPHLLAGMPDPVTGAPSPSLGGAPGRGRTQTPAGAGLPVPREVADPVPAGSTGRTFTIALPAGMKLLSLNDRLHFGERHRRTQDLKRAACVMALNAKVPRLERVSVVVEYQPRDRRLRDPDNVAPSGKAALDGIVAAKVLVDDSKTYVTGVRCTIGEPYPLGRLVLHLTEVTS